MCFGNNSQKAETPAAAPAAPLPAPEPPQIGNSRREENRIMFDGEDDPNYRVRKKGKKPGKDTEVDKVRQTETPQMPKMNPGAPIIM